MRKLVLFPVMWALLSIPLFSFSLKHEDPKGKSLAASPCAPSGAKAKLCASCGFGKKKDNCIKCGKHAGGGAQAVLCSNCGSGGKKEDCVKCGRWAAGSGAKAKLCSACNTGSEKGSCVKCGKWVGKGG